MENLQDDINKLQQETADIVKQVFEKPEISKGIDTSIQPVGYNLSPLVTCLEPMWEKWNIFVRKFPRVGPAGDATGKEAQWYQIDSVTNGMSSSYEGGLGSENATKSQLIKKPYKTIAVYDYVTQEAQAAGNGFLDAKGTSVIRALRKIRQKEEYKIIGGNITALATPVAPTVTMSAGGSIPAGSYSVVVAPLTAECLQSLIKNKNQGALTLVPYLDINGNAIAGRFWGVGAVSAAQAFTATTANKTATLAITPTADAFGYAVFVKAAADTNYTLQVISSYSTVAITNYYTTGQVAPTVEGSNDTLSYDGLLPQILAASSFNKDFGYTQLTAAETGVKEINTVLQGIFDAYNVAATNIYVSGNLRETITKANIQKGGVFNIVQSGELSSMTTGRTVGTYIHPATGEQLKIETHPYLPAGTILIMTEELDLPELGVSQLIEMHVAQDYFQRDVQQPLRRFPFEVYAYTVLGMRTPQYNAVLKNIKEGLAS